MKILPITSADFDEIQNEVQPQEWPSIIPHINNYVSSAHCYPIKAVENEKIVGIGATILHNDTAWLAHIIVNENFRKRGIGSFITQQLIDNIDSTRFKTIYLIATDMGEPVYKKLGFEVECEYIAFKDVDIKAETSPYIQPFDDKYKQQLYTLDKAIFNEERHNTIEPHLKDCLLFVRNENVEGYFIPTLGDGLIAATNNEAGIELQKIRLKGNKICVFPAANTPLIQFLNDNNFQELKRVPKMRLGEKRDWHPEKLYNRIGGNLG